MPSETTPLLHEGKKTETWEETKKNITHVAKHVHVSSQVVAIYQQWSGSDPLVLLGHAALKNISNDTNNSRGHLIKSGFADIGQAVIGFLLVLQAYSLSQTATTPSSSTTTPMYPSTTTEADLPTFPTEPPNDF